VSVSTAVSIGLAYVVQDAGVSPSGDTQIRVTGRDVVWLPQTLDDYLALPEHEAATCPKCEWAGVMMHRDVCVCVRCEYRWRWPFTVGGD
jgi:hypothetical protein